MLLLQARVAMAMKGYFTFAKAPKLEPHHQIVSCQIQDTCFVGGGSYPSAEMLTGLRINGWILVCMSTCVHLGCTKYVRRCFYKAISVRWHNIILSNIYQISFSDGSRAIIMHFSIWQKLKRYVILVAANCDDSEIASFLKSENIQGQIKKKIVSYHKGGQFFPTGPEYHRPQPQQVDKSHNQPSTVHNQISRCLGQYEQEPLLPCQLRL